MVVEEILRVCGGDTGKVLAQGSLPSEWEFVKKVHPVRLIDVI